MAKLYGFVMQDAHGNDVALSDYAGKVLLIVNTATRCGLTPQYAELQTLYARYAEEGLEILDFPCNQFRNQAPENSSEIEQVCHTKFGTQFKIFSKINVNGADAHPLYRYLKTQQPHDSGGGGLKGALLKLAAFGSKREAGDIEWNFTKFLVDRNGRIIRRFAPAVAPLAMENEIKSLL